MQRMELLQNGCPEEQEEKVIEEYEGGSDSESEGDDLEEKDLVKLHKIIETRH